MNTENHYQETDLGNIAPNPRGEYSESETYEYLDYVYYQGGSYLCLAELGTTITGVAPEPGKITEYWQAVALPGGLTPEYIAMHDRVVNLSEQVGADAEEVRTAEQNVSGMELNVTQMQEQTRQSAEAAEQSKDSAAGYAASADASRRAAEESEQNINAQVTGFDSHVAEKTSEAESNIEAVRIAANKAIIAQQEQSVNEVTRAGIEAISTARAAAQTATEKAQAAATSEKNAAASEAAAKLSEENATKMAGQVATDKEQIAHDRTAVENAKQEMAGSVAQIDQNTQGISELKGDIDTILYKPSNIVEPIFLESKNINNLGIYDDSESNLVIWSNNFVGVVYAIITSGQVKNVTSDYKWDGRAGYVSNGCFKNLLNDSYPYYAMQYSKADYPIEMLKEKFRIIQFTFDEDEIKIKNDSLSDSVSIMKKTQNLLTDGIFLDGFRLNEVTALTYNEQYKTILLQVKSGDVLYSNIFYGNDDLVQCMFTDEYLNPVKEVTGGFNVSELGNAMNGAYHTPTAPDGAVYAIINYTGQLRTGNVLDNHICTIDDVCITNDEEYSKSTSNFERFMYDTDKIIGLLQSAIIKPENSSVHYKNKKFAFIGDSTTADNMYDGCGLYRHLICNTLGAIIHPKVEGKDGVLRDLAMGGSAMEVEKQEYQYDSDGTVLNPVNGRLSMCGDYRTNLLQADTDHIFIMAGTNACGSAPDAETGIGSVGELSLSNNDCTTFIGAFNVCLSKIYYHFGLPAFYDEIDYSHIDVVSDGIKVPRIIILSPVNSGGVNNPNEYHFMRADALEKMSRVWGTLYFDTKRAMGLNPMTKKLYYRPDGLSKGDIIHFGVLGAVDIANGVIGLLRSHEPINTFDGYTDL